MALGTAIFLSALLFSLTLLIIATRDRIRWGRWLLLGSLGILVIAVATGSSLYVLNSYEWRRGVASSLAEIKLGDTQSDVRFRKGAYAEMCYMDGTRNRIHLTYESGTDPYQTSLFVEIRDDRVVRISIAKYINYLGPTSENSLTEFDSEERLREKWGPEDFIRTLDDSTRHYVYRRYQFAAILKDNKVGAVSVFDPSLFYLDAANPPKRTSECYDSQGKRTN